MMLNDVTTGMRVRLGRDVEFDWYIDVIPSGSTGTIVPSGWDTCAAYVLMDQHFDALLDSGNVVFINDASEDLAALVQI